MNKFKRKDQAPLCACGCGERVGWNKGGLNKWNDFIPGHHRKGRKHSQKSKDKMALRARGRRHSKSTKLKISIGHIKCRADGYCDAWSDQEFKQSYLKNYCEICSIKEIKRQCANGKIYSNLLLHHIDFNPQNCHPDNLQTLCRSCHTKLHHTGKTISKEHKEKVKAANIGRTISDKTRERMSIAAKKRGQNGQNSECQI